MLLFLFFLVFLLDDVQLVIPRYGIILYRSGRCCNFLQILLYRSGTGCCLRAGCASDPLWNFQDLQSNYKN